MTREKVPIHKRRRCSSACGRCRQRKERCNGERPCSRCIAAGFACGSNNSQSPTTSADTDTQPERRNRTVLTQPKQTSGSNPLAFIDGSGSDIWPSDTDEDGRLYVNGRLLCDARGGYVFVGDSANMTFAQNVQDFVIAKFGECDFSAKATLSSSLKQDLKDRNPMSPGGYDSSETLLSYEEVDNILDQYLDATCGLLDLFDLTDLRDGLHEWITTRPAPANTRGSMFYLIMAIGTQAVGDDERSINYFRRSQSNLAPPLFESPTCRTVQCYTLTTMYLLSAGYRNEAFMNFGIAVRAAHALDLHRAQLTPSLNNEYASRFWIWQSVRKVDIFLSASLGKPPSTSGCHHYSASDPCHPEMMNEFSEIECSLAYGGLCSVIEEILNTVYTKRGVSPSIAADVSRRYRHWSAGLKGSRFLEPSVPGETRLLGRVHLACAYHWSIVLFTRPFLIFHASLSGANCEDLKINSHFSQADTRSFSVLAGTGVESALTCVAIVENFLSLRCATIRLPIVLNAVFDCALAIGAAVFAEQLHHIPLQDGLTKAVRVLTVMASNNANAQRYLQIITLLATTTRDYMQLRRRLTSEDKSKRKAAIFGSFNLQMPFPMYPCAVENLQLPSPSDSLAAHSGLNFPKKAISWDLDSLISEFGYQSTETSSWFDFSDPASFRSDKSFAVDLHTHISPSSDGSGIIDVADAVV